MESNLTPGMAKVTIVKGQTKQSKIVEVFGPPDLVTHKDDMQIWTYEKIHNEIQSRGGYFTVLLAGGDSRRTVSSSTSTMLIVYFDSTDTVTDYRLSVVHY